MHRTALLLASLVLATGCTDGTTAEDPDVPPADSFSAGTCSTVAEDVRTLGRLLPRLGDGPKVEAEALEALRESQDGLRAVADGAEPAVKPALDRLVVSVGLVRIRATGNTYEPFLGEDAQEAYDAVVAVCTS